MNYIAYYRVSTKKQGNSGLGIEAQQAAVKQFISNQRRNSLNTSAEIIASYTDIESGKNNNRQELREALSFAKKIGATLIIAKLDRLSRNVTFIASLMDAKIPFICCDMPEANELTIHLMAALAQWERKAISTRIKEALKAAKARGTVLGRASKIYFTDETRKLGNKTNHETSLNNPTLRRARHSAELMRMRGFSMEEIAASLNENGYRTSNNCEFRKMQVKRLLDQVKELKTKQPIK